MQIDSPANKAPHQPRLTPWLNEKQVAEHLSCSLSKLRQDRHRCRGVPYVKLGRAVRYSLTDVEAYMSQHRITHDRSI